MVPVVPADQPDRARPLVPVLRLDRDRPESLAGRPDPGCQTDPARLGRSRGPQSHQWSAASVEVAGSVQGSTGLVRTRQGQHLTLLP